MPRALVRTNYSFRSSEVRNGRAGASLRGELAGPNGGAIWSRKQNKYLCLDAVCLRARGGEAESDGRQVLPERPGSRNLRIVMVEHPSTHTRRFKSSCHRIIYVANHERLRKAVGNRFCRNRGSLPGRLRLRFVLWNLIQTGEGIAASEENGSALEG
jgi:hypothetical protein